MTTLIESTHNVGCWLKPFPFLSVRIRMINWINFNLIGILGISWKLKHVDSWNRSLPKVGSLPTWRLTCSDWRCWCRSKVVISCGLLRLKQTWWCHRGFSHGVTREYLVGWGKSWPMSMITPEMLLHFWQMSEHMWTFGPSVLLKHSEHPNQCSVWISMLIAGMCFFS